MGKIKISTDLKREPTMRFSKAIRDGNLIEIDGKTATNKHGVTVGIDNPYAQTVEIIKVIEKELHEAGGTLADVIRTRVYITDLSRWEEVAKAHSEFFEEIKPTSSLLGVNRLMNPEQLVEMEATALIKA